MGGEAHLDDFATSLAFPLGMVVIFITEFTNGLDKSLSSLKTVKLEGLDQGVLNVLEPSNTITVFNCIDFVGSHLDKLGAAQFIERLMLILDFLQLGHVKSELMLELHRQVGILLDRNQEATVS